MILLASLTGTELDVMAEQEREKGNEAFRAGDYEEALEHYNTSVKINSNIVTFNNRAMTCKKLILFIFSNKYQMSDYNSPDIKLQRYEDALNDCNLVLSAEYTNIKALLRRAMALQHLERSSQVLQKKMDTFARFAVKIFFIKQRYMYTLGIGRLRSCLEIRTKQCSGNFRSKEIKETLRI